MPLAHGEPAPGDTPRYVHAFPLIALLFGALAVPALLGLRRIPPPATPLAAELHRGGGSWPRSARRRNTQLGHPLKPGRFAG